MAVGLCLVLSLTFGFETESMGRRLLAMRVIRWKIEAGEVKPALETLTS